MPKLSPTKNPAQWGSGEVPLGGTDDGSSTTLRYWLILRGIRLNNFSLTARRSLRYPPRAAA